MQNRVRKTDKIHSLMEKARHAWATGALNSDDDFEFVEKAWVVYHLDWAFTQNQVKRLEQIVRYVEEGISMPVVCNS